MGGSMSQRPFTVCKAFGAANLAALAVFFFAAAIHPASAQTGGSAARLLFGATQPTPAAPVPAPAPAATASSAIPLPEVAARAEDLQRLLRNTSDQLPSSDQLAAVNKVVADRDKELQSQYNETSKLLAGTPSALELREEENFWRALQTQTGSLRRQLHDWANIAQSAVQHIQAQQPQWTATLQQNQGTPGLGPTLDVIRQSVADLKQYNTQAQDLLRMIVNLQVQAASQDQLALDVLDRLQSARQSEDSRLLERDSFPLWQISQRRQQGENNLVYVAASTRLLGIRAFAVQAQGALTALLLLLIVSLVGTYRLHRAAANLHANNAEQEEVLHIARHWIALGLLPPLLCAYLLAPIAPLALIGLAILISFIPILRLLPPIVSPHFRRLLYSLTGVYALSAFIAWLSFSAVIKREVQFAVNFAVFALFAFLVRPARTLRYGGNDGLPRVGMFGLRVAVGALGLSLVANLFGYVRLAQFLSIFCLYSTFIAISLYTGARVFTRLLLAGIDRPGAQQLAVVRRYRDAIVRWGPRALRWSGVAIWLLVTLNLLGLSDWLGQTLKGLLDFRIAGSSYGITLGGIIGFFVILLGGYFISSSIRFLLREELLSRSHLSRGLPELISSTLHYLLLLLVFFFAVNAGGVELNKFTVLTGALGVGVGFGLQNIVNNFISGLILQFERPIHIGDVLDVDGTNGTVTRIGIRSSTVKTFQGAEVIIPNANFISGKVINWTLSEPLRRMDLNVGVAYGSDIKLVTTLLEQAATENENVLTSPPPAAYFKGFGDSSVNFQLQFWVMQESNTVKVTSEVGVAVIQLFAKAGIEIPNPQRDLHLRSVDAGAAAALLSPNGADDTGADNGPGTRQPTLALEQPKKRAVAEE
jgi:small-conductance mechanosensitive channel